MAAALSPLARIRNMISGDEPLIVRSANLDDLDEIKHLADQHKHELGFIIRGALQRSIESGELIVAVSSSQEICGFVQFRHRRDFQTTLYNLVVAATWRNRGVGKLLVDNLRQSAAEHHKKQILLRCPTDLAANDFYHNYGFHINRIEQGKSRQLNVWVLDLNSSS